MANIRSSFKEIGKFRGGSVTSFVRACGATARHW
jgi:hypothetical protein